MNKLWQKYLLILVCFLMTTSGFAGSPDTTKIPCLKLNNHRLKDLISDWIKEGHIEENDVVLIGFIEENNDIYMSFTLSRKNRLFLLQASSLYRTQKFIGYSKILNHDCFVFGDKAKLFFTKKDSVQIPNYFDWLLSLNQMEWVDFFPPQFHKNLDGSLEEVEIHIQDRGTQYKYANKRFMRWCNGEYQYKGTVPNVAK